MWPELHFNIKDLGAALSVLTAMITPALLMSACGTFILSTSNRLARIVDRVRYLSEHLELLARANTEVQLREERILRGREEIKMQSKRLSLVQQALTFLYLAAVTFVCCSVSIGLTASVSLRYYWVPVALGILGAVFLLCASIILLIEARKAVRDLHEETEFHRRVTRQFVGLNSAAGHTSAVTEVQVPHPPARSAR